VYGNAWVSENAQVFGNAWVSRGASVYGYSKVYGHAEVSGNARVSENVQVYGNAEVYGHAEVYGNAEVYGKARVSGYAVVSENARVSGCASVTGIHRSDGYTFSYVPDADGVMRVIAGCRYFTMQEARKHWAETRGGTTLGDETMAILDALEALSKVKPEGCV
jgi:tetrahydrodipicolinate N-succinyltransferase